MKSTQWLLLSGSWGTEINSIVLGVDIPTVLLCHIGPGCVKSLVKSVVETMRSQKPKGVSVREG